MLNRMTDTEAVSRIPGVRETVLVAPDSFKGTFTAGEVAEAIGSGLREGGQMQQVGAALAGHNLIRLP